MRSPIPPQLALMLCRAPYAGTCRLVRGRNSRASREAIVPSRESLFRLPEVQEAMTSDSCRRRSRLFGLASVGACAKGAMSTFACLTLEFRNVQRAQASSGHRRCDRSSRYGGSCEEQNSISNELARRRPRIALNVAALSAAVSADCYGLWSRRP